tara:strand:- start:59032 stop:59406 length:375 start_codon:yes stop_codon:yes gene_type:complete
MKPEEIAFNDFKGAVSIQEFEAVLTLCKKQYEKVKDILNTREKFLEDTKDKFLKAESEIEDERIKAGMNKLVDALVKRADEELVKAAKEELKDIKNITEFLRRFGNANDYPELETSFINYIKKY